VPEDIRVNPATSVDRVGRTPVYPVSGPWPAGDAPIRTQAELGHPEARQRRRRVRREWPGNIVPLAIGRAILGGYFVYNGINHFKSHEMLSGYAGSKNVPMPKAAVIGSGAMALAGGLSILTGYKPKIGAALVTTFLAGVTRMHDFWTIEDPQQRSQEMINFTKNMAIIGGACLAAALPEPWPASLSGGRGGAMTAPAS